MKHPFKRGDRVRCIKASEISIPIKEGQEYTVLKTFRGNQNPDDDDIEEMANTPGICVQEVPGWFTADRFKVIENEH